MTTNKPEVLTLWRVEEAWGDDVEIKCVRLSDYEAMRKRAEEAWAENNQLNTQLNVLVEGMELLLRRLEKMPRKIWVKEQLGEILKAHHESEEKSK